MKMRFEAIILQIINFYLPCKFFNQISADFIYWYSTEEELLTCTCINRLYYIIIINIKFKKLCTCTLYYLIFCIKSQVIVKVY